MKHELKEHHYWTCGEYTIIQNMYFCVKYKDQFLDDVFDTLEEAISFIDGLEEAGL